MEPNRYLSKPGVFHDKTGLVYGRLTVIGREPNSKEVVWNCSCICGNVVKVRAASLQGGLTTSCGCYHKEVATETKTTHGMSNSPEYRIWRAMLNRCNNPNADNYHAYGGRGITVCSRWTNSFENFYSDMGNCGGNTLERIENDKGYSPDNCRWASRLEQANNRRSTRKLIYNGNEMSIKQFSQMFDIPYQTILNRINSGMTPAQAVAKRFIQKLDEDGNG